MFARVASFEGVDFAAAEETLDVMADPVFALARINEGKMRPLAVSTAKRLRPVADGAGSPRNSS